MSAMARFCCEMTKFRDQLDQVVNDTENGPI